MSRGRAYNRVQNQPATKPSKSYTVGAIQRCILWPGWQQDGHQSCQCPMELRLNCALTVTSTSWGTLPGWALHSLPAEPATPTEPERPESSCCAGKLARNAAPGGTRRTRALRSPARVHATLTVTALQSSKLEAGRLVLVCPCLHVVLNDDRLVGLAAKQPFL